MTKPDDVNQHPDFLSLVRRVRELEVRAQNAEDMLLLLLLTHGAQDLAQGIEAAARTGVLTSEQARAYQARLALLNAQIKQISEAFNETSGVLIKRMWERPDRPAWLALANELGKTPEEIDGRPNA